MMEMASLRPGSRQGGRLGVVGRASWPERWTGPRADRSLVGSRLSPRHHGHGDKAGLRMKQGTPRAHRYNTLVPPPSHPTLCGPAGDAGRHEAATWWQLLTTTRLWQLWPMGSPGAGRGRPQAGQPLASPSPLTLHHQTEEGGGVRPQLESTQKEQLSRKDEAQSETHQTPRRGWELRCVGASTGA